MYKVKKVKDTCGTKSYATCVFYEGVVSENSSLAEESCIVVEEALEDIYGLIGDINTGTDTADFGKDGCIEYEASGDTLSVLDILNKQNEELCLLKESVEGSTDEDGGESGGNGEDPSATLDELNLDLDLKCLELDCDEITSLKGLFQALVDKVCELQEVIDNNSTIKSTIL